MIGDLLLILMMHQGRDHAISADNLLTALRTYGQAISGLPDLRQLIHDARQLGHLIASSQEGYYLPTNLKEATEYINEVWTAPSLDRLKTRRIQRRRAYELFGRQLRMI